MFCLASQHILTINVHSCTYLTDLQLRSAREHLALREDKNIKPRGEWGGLKENAKLGLIMEQADTVSEKVWCIQIIH